MRGANGSSLKKELHKPKGISETIKKRLRDNKQSTMCVTEHFHRAKPTLNVNESYVRTT